MIVLRILKQLRHASTITRQFHLPLLLLFQLRLIYDCYALGPSEKVFDSISL
jgi:hypothetical protein